MTLHLDMDRLASLAATLQELADEATRLESSVPTSSVLGDLQPAVREAAEIARDVVDVTLIGALKERLSETREIMINVAAQFRNADNEALAVAMEIYTDATGHWGVSGVLG